MYIHIYIYRVTRANDGATGARKPNNELLFGVRGWIIVSAWPFPTPACWLEHLWRGPESTSGVQTGDPRWGSRVSCNFLFLTCNFFLLWGPTPPPHLTSLHPTPPPPPPPPLTYTVTPQPTPRNTSINAPQRPTTHLPTPHHPTPPHTPHPPPDNKCLKLKNGPCFLQLPEVPWSSERRGTERCRAVRQREEVKLNKTFQSELVELDNPKD